MDFFQFVRWWDSNIKGAKERFDDSLLDPKDLNLGWIELVAVKFIRCQHSITLNLAKPKIDARRLAKRTLNLMKRALVFMVNTANIHQYLVLYFHFRRGV